MARFMPAPCNPWAIAHAIDRLFATPKTTAVRPFRSSNMNELSRKIERITASLETRLAASRVQHRKRRQPRLYPYAWLDGRRSSEDPEFLEKAEYCPYPAGEVM